MPSEATAKRVPAVNLTMKIREDYPVYVNPDFNELVELGTTPWDTIRIMESEEYLVMGSGYGNTHHSLVQVMRANVLTKTEQRRWHAAPFILYHENGIAYFNLEDVSGRSRARYMEASKFFHDKWLPDIRELCRISDLAL